MRAAFQRAARAREARAANQSREFFEIFFRAQFDARRGALMTKFAHEPGALPRAENFAQRKKHADFPEES